METKFPSAALVKQNDENSEENPEPEKIAFPSEIPEVECENLCRRFEGYLMGWFTNHVPCVLAAEFKRRFQKRTGYSRRHIDDVFPVFQRWSTNFRFKRQRLGRSTCVVITLRYRPLVLTTAEVRRRLVGAIRKHVAKSGGAHVDRLFLEKFHQVTGLPPEQIFHAWRTLRWIDGLKSRWRGRGGGVNFHVSRLEVREISHPENTGGISPPTGGKDQKTGRALPSAIPDGNRGSLRSPTRRAGEGSPRGLPAPDPLETGPPEQPDRSTTYYAQGDGHRSPRAGPPKPAVRNGPDFQWKPAAKPLHVCDHWIGAARIASKANFLAFGPLQDLHAEFWRVRFRPAHARNFADEALRAGFLDGEICAAYRVGLDETHASAARDWHGDIASDGMREPSQAVNRAWLRLRADNRTDAQRWLAIFRGEAKPQRLFVKPAAVYVKPDDKPAPAAGSGELGGAAVRPAKPKAETFRTIGPGLRVRVDELDDAAAKPRPPKWPDVTPALLRAESRGHLDPARTWESYCRERGMTWEKLRMLPRAEQQRFVREMHVWQKARERPPEIS